MKEMDEALAWNDRIMDRIYPLWRKDPLEQRTRRAYAFTVFAYKKLPPYLFKAWFHRYCLGLAYKDAESRGIKWARLITQQAVRALKKEKQSFRIAYSPKKR